MWGMTLQYTPALLALLLFTHLLIVFTVQGMQFIRRSWAFLLWLVTPIVLMHALFTPGTYLHTPFYMPLSVEGLQQGTQLSLHLLLMFFSSALLVRSLSKQEWKSLLFAQPVCAKILMPYIYLLEQAKEANQMMIYTQYHQWAKAKQWAAIPDVATALLRNALQTNKALAHKLWLEWDYNMQHNENTKLSIFRFSSIDKALVMLSVIGGLLFWVS